MVLRRDEVAAAALVIEGTEARCSVVHGDLVDPGVVERAIGEYEVDTVFHLAAQTIVGTANRSPVSTFESNIRGTWTLLEACRTHGRRAHGRRRLRQGLRARPRTLPYTESHPLDAALPLRRLEGVHGPDRALLLAHLRPAGGRHALRQHLRRRRPEPVAPRARGGRRGAGRAGAGDPLGRDACSATSSTSRTRWPPTWRSPTRCPARAARRSTPAATRRTASWRSSSCVCRVAGTDVAPDVRGTGTLHGEIDRQFVDSTKLRERTGWRPAVDLEEGLRRTVEWYRAHPEALAA